MKYTAILPIGLVEGLIDLTFAIPNKSYPIKIIISAYDTAANGLIVTAREADTTTHINGKIIYEKTDPSFRFGLWIPITLKTAKPFIYLNVKSTNGASSTAVIGIVSVTNEQATK